MSSRSCVSLLLLAAASTSCATLDTTRPIEKGTFSFEQGGHTLNAVSTLDALSKIEACRASAERARSLRNWGAGLLIGGAGLAVSSAIPASTNASEGLYWVGLATISAGIITSIMSGSSYARAVDQYNATFPAGMQAPPVTSYVAPARGGATAGVAGSF